MERSHLLTGHTLYLTLGGLLGPESSYKQSRVGLEVLTVSQGPALGEAMPGPSGEGGLNSSGTAPRGLFMRRSQQNEGVCGSQLHQDLPTDPIIIFLPYQWPSFKDDALVVGLSHAWGKWEGAGLWVHCLLWLLTPSCPMCVVPAITVPWLLGGPGLHHLMLLCFPPRAAPDMAPCHP